LDNFVKCGNCKHWTGNEDEPGICENEIVLEDETYFNDSCTLGEKLSESI